MDKPIVKKKADVFKASLIIIGKTYKSKGKTISEAIDKLNPGNCKGKAILCIEHGKNKRERILTAPFVSRLFNTRGMIREVMLKQTSILFDNV